MSDQYRLPARNTTTVFPPRQQALTLRGEPDLAFLEFVTCQICNAPLQGSRREFYISSCGHIFCSDDRHQHREGTCTACKNKATIHRLEEGLPSQIVAYFQSPRSLLSTISSAFQQQQLMRVVRAQRKKIAEYDALVGDLSSSLKALQEDDAKLKQQLQDVTRQLDEERAQHHQLQGRYADLEHRAATATTPPQLSNRQTRHPPPVYGDFPMRSASRQSSGAFAMPSGRGSVRPTNAFVSPATYNHQEQHEMDQRASKRQRETMEGYNASPAPPAAALGRQMQPQLPVRPSTGLPPRTMSSMGNGDMRRTRSSTGFNSPAALRTNLDQYKYREEQSGPMTLPQPPAATKPSFTLARPTHGDAQPPRWSNASRNERPDVGYGQPHGMMMIPEGEETLC